MARRGISPFSLSFLDIMACGFGAVTLLFLILRHDPSPGDPMRTAEIFLLQEDIQFGHDNLAQLRNSLDEQEERLVATQGLSRHVLEQIEETQRELSVQRDPEQEIALLRRQVEQARQELAQLEATDSGHQVRQFIGQGDRQYLTGLKLGGQRVLILVDASASMLSDTLVNVLRLRNMDEDARRQADKWQRVVRTTEWLVAQLPADSQFQVYVFNTRSHAVNSGTAGTWLQADNRNHTDAVLNALRQVAPADGTSLLNAFAVINQLGQRPDNVFLLTDGLPTQAAEPPRGATISGQDRLRLFEQAVRTIPRQVPVNVILFPMEGDPAAAPAFWQLAVHTQGAFISPAEDWP